MKKNQKTILESILVFAKEVNRITPKKYIWGMLIFTYVLMVFDGVSKQNVIDNQIKQLSTQDLFINEYRDILHESNQKIKDLERGNEISDVSLYEEKNLEIEKDLLEIEEMNLKILEMEKKLLEMEKSRKGLEVGFGNSMNIFLLEKELLKVYEYEEENYIGVENEDIEEYEFNPKINELLIIDKTLNMF